MMYRISRYWNRREGTIMYVNTITGTAWIVLNHVQALLESTASFGVILASGAIIPLTEESYREIEKRIVEGTS